MYVRLGSTRRHWNRLAAADPLWAVLTDHDKKGNRWSVDEFFALGSAEVASIMAEVRRYHPALRTSEALDFGCGVGRLSQGLAPHFERVIGLDIAEKMLSQARLHNRHGQRVSYVHNTKPDLRLFADGRFNFVLSLITLQHKEPAYARRYIAEFVRVCAAGGIVYFQVPSRVGPSRRPFTLWPDILARRCYRDLRSKFWLKEPVMAMHAIPQAEIETILRRAGAELLRVAPLDAADEEIESRGYLCRRP